MQPFSTKSDRGRLREVVTCKRLQIWWFDWETFGILKNWSLRRGARLQEIKNIEIWLGNIKYFGKVVAEDRWSLTRGGRNDRPESIMTGAKIGDGDR